MDEGLLEAIYRFLPVLVRMSGVMVASPILGRPGVPSRFKIGLAVWLSAAIYPFASPESVDPGAWQKYVLIILGELVVGLGFGFVVTLVFSAMYLAGQLMDVPMGFGMVNVLDPHTGAQVPILAQFQYVLAILVFLTINGHHELLRVVAESFRIIPIAGASFGGVAVNSISRVFADMFALGFRLSLPVVGALFLTDVALGIISRSVPQINVFILGFPAKIVVGFVIFVFFLPAYVALISMIFDSGGDLQVSLAKYLRSLVPGGAGH